MIENKEMDPMNFAISYKTSNDVIFGTFQKPVRPPLAKIETSNVASQLNPNPVLPSPGQSFSKSAKFMKN